MATTIHKQLATKQDLAIGNGKVTQVRNGQTLELDEIDFQTRQDMILGVNPEYLNDKLTDHSIATRKRYKGHSGQSLYYYDEISVTFHFYEVSSGAHTLTTRALGRGFGTYDNQYALDGVDYLRLPDTSHNETPWSDDAMILGFRAAGFTDSYISFYGNRQGIESIHTEREPVIVGIPYPGFEDNAYDRLHAFSGYVSGTSALQVMLPALGTSNEGNRHYLLVEHSGVHLHIETEDDGISRPAGSYILKGRTLGMDLVEVHFTIQAGSGNDIYQAAVVHGSYAGFYADLLKVRQSRYPVMFYTLEKSS